MGVLADRSPTVLTVCRVVERPGARAASIERRTVQLRGREAILVESLVRMRRRHRARKGPAEGTPAELR
jgi:hypothetical protein